MSRTKRKKPAHLEAHRLTPTGGLAPRCQAVKRDGTQCGGFAREGFTVCPRHGAGFAARERAGESKPVSLGRPLTHGLYSKRGRRRIAEVVAELEAAQVNLDDSDGEMRVLRGTLAYLLGQADVHEDAGDTIRGVMRMLEGVEVTLPAEAAAVGRAMGNADRLLGRSESWVRALLDASRFIVKASKERAETLTKFVHVIRVVLWEVCETEQLDVLEGRLMREFFIPCGIAMPDRDDPLEG